MYAKIRVALGGCFSIFRSTFAPKAGFQTCVCVLRLMMVFNVSTPQKIRHPHVLGTVVF